MMYTYLNWGCIMENWVPAHGWHGLYEVSSLGNVRSVKRPVKTNIGIAMRGGGVLRKIVRKVGGYEVVNFTNSEGRREQILVHRLVLLSFLGEPELGKEACHNNGIRHDNRLENLRWDSRKSNHADKKEHGTWQGGEKNGYSRLTEEQVRYIRSSTKTLDCLANEIGVSKSCIEKAKYRATWKHVD